MKQSTITQFTTTLGLSYTYDGPVISRPDAGRPAVISDPVLPASPCVSSLRPHEALAYVRRLMARGPVHVRLFLDGYPIADVAWPILLLQLQDLEAGGPSIPVKLNRGEPYLDAADAFEERRGSHLRDAHEASFPWLYATLAEEFVADKLGFNPDGETYLLAGLGAYVDGLLTECVEESEAAAYWRRYGRR